MGLLDDLLAGAMGQSTGREPMNQPSQPSSGGMDMSRILTALLPVVLAMLANRRSSTRSNSPYAGGPGSAATGGGLGDILGSLLGGAGAGQPVIEPFFEPSSLNWPTLRRASAP